MWREQLQHLRFDGLAATKQRWRIPPRDANERFHPRGKKAAREALRVVAAVRGDDVVGRVAQLMAHEAPRHGAWLRIGLHADGEGQALARSHLDGSVVNETRVHESFICEERRKLLFTQNLQNIGVKSTAVVERNRANPHTV